MRSRFLPKTWLAFGSMMVGTLVILAGCGQATAPAATTAAPTKAAAPAATTAPAGAATTAPAATKPAAPAATTAPAAAAKIDYPTRVIELVVPFAAGGAADVAARRIASIAEKDLGQSITIANVTGAGGAVAYQRVKNAKPDGYSLLWSSAAMATLPAQGNVDFDYKAFDHVAMVATETVTFAVSSKSPWQTMQAMIDAGKQRGATQPFTMGNSGIGSFTHLSAVALSDKTGMPITHIAFGTGLAVTNLIGGHIDSSVQHPAEILAALKNGDVKMLAVTAANRIETFKDVPTMKELGYPDLVLEQFRAVSVPKGTPPEIIAKVEAALLKAADSPEWAAQVALTGSQTVKKNSAELTKYVAEQDTQIATLAAAMKGQKSEEAKSVATAPAKS